MAASYEYLVHSESHVVRCRVCEVCAPRFDTKHIRDMTAETRIRDANEKWKRKPVHALVHRPIVTHFIRIDGIEQARDGLALSMTRSQPVASKNT